MLINTKKVIDYKLKFLSYLDFGEMVQFYND